MASREFKVGDRVRFKSKELYMRAYEEYSSRLKDAEGYGYYRASSSDYTGWDTICTIKRLQTCDVSTDRSNWLPKKYIMLAQVSMAERVAKLLGEDNGI